MLRSYVAKSKEAAGERRTVKANLYAEAYPAECMASLRETGMAMASFGALRGFTAESFRGVASVLGKHTRAGQIPFAALALNMTDDGAVSVRLESAVYALSGWGVGLGAASVGGLGVS